MYKLDEGLMFFRKIFDFFISLFHRGPKDTFLLVQANLKDKNSSEPFARETSEAINPRIDGGKPYYPSKYRELSHLLSEISKEDTDVFVDIGAGKGRAMLIAFESGYKKVKGIELSRPLYKDAQSILTLSEANHELLNIDAKEYHPAENDNVFYLYDPFDDETLTKVLENISKKKGKIIYHNNIATKAQVFSSLPSIGKPEIKNISGSRFFIYSINP